MKIYIIRTERIPDRRKAWSIGGCVGGDWRWYHATPEETRSQAIAKLEKSFGVKATHAVRYAGILKASEAAMTIAHLISGED